MEEKTSDEDVTTQSPEAEILQHIGGEIQSQDVETQDSSNIFPATYSVKPSIMLSALPEDVPVSDFNNPAIQITSEDIDPLSDSVSAVVSPTIEIGQSASLSPSISGSPNLRRRSFVGGHRRRSSAKSLVGLGIVSSSDLRQRLSVGSAQAEFEDFQDGDAGSDFGDFDDFEEGEFEDHDIDNTQTGDTQSSEASNGNVALLQFPDMTDSESLRFYMETITDELFMTATTTNATMNTATSTGNLMAENMEGSESDEEDDSPFMLTDRAVSLWKQLTAPPPLQPPDWKRSRIRRLFLVSLGIPVDLDEILPKMTHKKLVLPSTRRHKDKKTADERRSRKKMPPPPDFEVSAARQLCSTTREALDAMTVRDREIHVATLRAHTVAASALLTYWLEQRESAQSEKDTFEQVVSNLVQYHKKQKDEEREKATNASKKSKSRFSIRG